MKRFCRRWCLKVALYICGGFFLFKHIIYRLSTCGRDPVATMDMNFTSNPVSYMATKQDVYVVNNIHICEGIKSLKTLVLVHSAVRHFDRRLSFRETWANYKLFSSNFMRVVFVLGTTEDREIQNRIMKESSENGDIVQGDFLDVYRNLSHKAITGLRWIHERCSQAQFIVKVDDDVFLNVFTLFNLLTKEFSGKDRHIWCHMLPGRNDAIPRKGTKWDVAPNEFQDFVCYPFAFCRGYIVIYTSDIVSGLFEKAKSTPLFHLDDVFVYGMLAAKTGDISHTFLENINANETESMDCFQQKRSKCSYFVSRVDDPRVMKQFWEIILRENNSYIAAHL